MIAAEYSRGIEVDGIISVPRLWVRPLFEYMDDHPFTECGVCVSYPATTKANMHWVPGDPIVRFTSSGLEVTGCAT